MPTKNLYQLSRKRPINIIGLNSGTSGDGLDIALVRFGLSKAPEVLKCHTWTYPDDIRRKIISLGEPESRDGVEWMSLDSELGYLFGRTVKRFLAKIQKAGLTAKLIGSHGQTIRHIPREFARSLTLQVGDPALIAGICGLPVVSDFRRSDIAAGGEGAPLSPILHEGLFRARSNWRAIVNIGGIANITILPPKVSSMHPIAGDSGPGNMLIDLAMKRFYGRSFDRNGRIASSGIPQERFIDRTLSSSFFKLKPPKSTGRELFGASFFESAMNAFRGLSPADVVATLSSVTVLSIADFILRFGPKIEEIYLCGGGAKNSYIVGRLKELFPGKIIEDTSKLGFDPDYLEAILWAHLAYRFISENPIYAGNFTGAKKPYIPGKICLP